MPEWSAARSPSRFEEIGRASAVLGNNDVDAVVLTGGMAYSKRLTGTIEEHVRYMAPVLIFPGENELEALAQGALRVLRGLEKPRYYEG